MDLPVAVAARAQGYAYAIVIGLVLVVAAAVGGFFVGIEWQQGREAIVARSDLDAEIGQMRKYSKDAAQDFRTAADRMQAISKDYQEQRDASESFYGDLESRWEKLLSDGDTPVDPCPIGADGMRVWNAANSGALAEPARDDLGRPDATLQAPATTGGGHTEGASEEPHQGDGGAR